MKNIIIGGIEYILENVTVYKHTVRTMFKSKLRNCWKDLFVY